MGEKWSFTGDAGDAVESGSYELLQPGTYKFTIDDKEDKTTREKNYPMALLKLRALEGPSEGTMLHNVVCFPQGEKGHGFMLHFLHAVGLPYDGDVEFDSDEFIGREFTADVIVEDYPAKDGTTKQRNSIKRVLIAESDTGAASEEKTTKEESVEEAEVVEEEEEKPARKNALARKTTSVNSKPLSKTVAKTNETKKQLVGVGGSRRKW